jgi:hypothetical protein
LYFSICGETVNLFRFLHFHLFQVSSLDFSAWTLDRVPNGKCGGTPFMPKSQRMGHNKRH